MNVIFFNKKCVVTHRANENYFLYDVYTFQGVKGAKILQKVSSKCSKTELNFLLMDAAQTLYRWLQ